MKNSISIIAIALFLVASCASKTDNETNTTTINAAQKDGLKIYAFHGTRQCETCKNMKLFTKSTLDKYFKSELKSGAIVYQVIDVDDESNYELAEKFEATGTALMIDKVEKGKDKITDWSEFAFEFANGDQAAFENELKRMIQEQLK